MTGLRALVTRLTEARANRTKGCKCFDEYVCPRCAIVATAEADLADAITPDVLAAVEQSTDLRTTLARLTADLATQTKRWLDAERADSDKAHRLAALGGELFAARLAVETLTAERDEALADVAAAEAPLTDIVLRHHAAMSQVERERDEARGLLRDVDTAWSDCLLTEDQADVLERIVAHLGAK